jgi:hypothetical protein
MRTKPLIGEKVWFAPRRFGWGLDPVSIEGWVVIGALIAGDRVAKRQQLDPGKRFALLSPLLLVILLKGTRPGGPKARREFKEAQA